MSARIAKGKAAVEIVGGIFAELPPHLLPIVRAAMDRASGHVSTDRPMDLQNMMHAMACPN